MVTSHKGLLTSNKVPFIFDRNTNTLCGHFGKNNPQLVDIEYSKEVLAIFTGPHSYISPRWNETPNLVPTWNYQTVQVRGDAIIVDENRLFQILELLSEFHETKFSQPWSMTEIEPDKLEMMLGMIVGFQINIKEIKFKEKMSQNRNQQYQKSIINALRKQQDQLANKVADVMNKNIKL